MLNGIALEFGFLILIYIFFLWRVKTENILLVDFCLLSLSDRCLEIEA